MSKPTQSAAHQSLPSRTVAQVRLTGTAVLARRRLVNSGPHALRLVEVRQRALDVLELAVRDQVTVRLDDLARLDLEVMVVQVCGAVVGVEVPVLVSRQENGRQGRRRGGDGGVEDGVVVQAVGDLSGRVSDWASM